MKGRPGMLTITTSDGLSASTRRVVAEQAISRLRALKHGGANVTLDAGARQAVRMTLARPLADDPVLLGRQQQIAALKVVGSGVDASQVGTGKTVSTGRALAHRAATTPRLRAMVVAEGRLLSQWRDELHPRRAGPRAAAAGAQPGRARCSTTAGRWPRRSARSTASSATGRASRWSPTACSTATPPSSRSSPGTCWSPTRRCATPTPPPRPTRRCGTCA